MIDAWMITTAAHAVLTVAYIWIAGIVLAGLKGIAWRDNALAVAALGIFASCAVGHGVHVVHVMEHVLGGHGATQAAAIVQANDPLLMGWSVVTATVATTYLVLRQRRGLLLRGAPVTHDLARQQEQAEALRAPVQEAIRLAQHAMLRGDVATARQAIQIALMHSKETIDHLVEGDNLRPGALRRPT